MSLRKTYFQYDGELMFKESIKMIVKNTLAEIEKDKGLRIEQQPALITA